MIEKYKQKKNFMMGRNTQDYIGLPCFTSKFFFLYFRLEVTTVSTVLYYSFVWRRRDRHAKFWLTYKIFIFIINIYHILFINSKKGKLSYFILKNLICFTMGMKTLWLYLLIKVEGKYEGSSFGKNSTSSEFIQFLICDNRNFLF